METNILKMITIADFASLANALSGIFAILAVLNGDTFLSAQLLLLAIVFDSIDGTLARKFSKNNQEHKVFGETIDSLADVISFGVAPSIILYMITYSNLSVVPMILLVACGILRLTRYNALISEEVSTVESFIGLPIPVSAMLFGSLILSSFIDFNMFFIMTVIISILMVSNIEYPKIKDTKIVGILAIFTILCIVPNVNDILYHIPSYILVILTFIYIFGTIIYNYIGFSKANIVPNLNTNSVDDMLGHLKKDINGKSSSKSKKGLYKK